MNLKPGTELFKVVLGDGTSFTSSDMTLESVELVDLLGNAKAVKGSDRFNGRQLKPYSNAISSTLHGTLCYVTVHTTCARLST